MQRSTWNFLDIFSVNSSWSTKQHVHLYLNIGFRENEPPLRVSTSFYFVAIALPLFSDKPNWIDRINCPTKYWPNNWNRFKHWHQSFCDRRAYRDFSLVFTVHTAWNVRKRHFHYAIWIFFCFCSHPLIHTCITQCNLFITKLWCNKN